MAEEYLCSGCYLLFTLSRVNRITAAILGYGSCRCLAIELVVDSAVYRSDSLVPAIYPRYPVYSTGDG